MGWNDRMDFPGTYGAQYSRDFVYQVDDTTANIRAEQRAEGECPHESSRAAGDGLKECVDCGQTFLPAPAHAPVA